MVTLLATLLAWPHKLQDLVMKAVARPEEMPIWEECCGRMLPREPCRQDSVNEENFRVSLRTETVKGIITDCRLAWSTRAGSWPAVLHFKMLSLRKKL